MEALIYLAFVVTGYIMGRMTKDVVVSKKENTTEKIVDKINPLKAYREHKEREADLKEMEYYEAILENANNYDGTSLGQKDIPERS